MRTVGNYTAIRESLRDRLQFSDATKVRLHPALHRLQLRANAAGKYPLDADLYIRGPLLAPDAMRQWLAVSTLTVEPVDDAGTAVGTVRYRVSDGTNDRWWNGSVWAVASAGQWNTLAQLQTNFATFPVTTRRIRLVYGLRTTDPAVTPCVLGAMVLYQADILSTMEEVLYRSLIRQLRTVTVPVEFAVDWPTATTAVVLADLLDQQEAVEISGVSAVFNHTDDPDHLTALSFTYVSGTLTLAVALPADKKAVIRCDVAPVVAFTTDQDYDQVSKLPAIVVDTVTERFTGEIPSLQHVTDVTTLAAICVRSPRQGSYEVTLRAMANRGLDLIRLTDAITSWVRTARVLRIGALDQSATMVLDRQFSVTPRPDQTGVMDDRCTIRILDVEAWIFPQTAGTGVGEVVTSITSE